MKSVVDYSASRAHTSPIGGPQLASWACLGVAFLGSLVIALILFGPAREYAANWDFGYIALGYAMTTSIAICGCVAGLIGMASGGRAAWIAALLNFILAAALGALGLYFASGLFGGRGGPGV